MLACKYSGEFLSKASVRWRAEILVDGHTGDPTDLTFPADSPLKIEWGETDKLDPVQASSATLKVISETDREFVDLYTVAVGTVRLDIYRNNVLYWSGGIDTELYEEPYSTADGYEVTLTFSDFACLDRFNWSETGFLSIYDIIALCLGKSGVNYSRIQTYISTQRYSTAIALSSINVLQDNFYDEDGEGMTARDVLEAVLKPFALRLIQKAGTIYVYDLNALHALTASDVEWASTDQTLGVDTIYNNVKVTFSPYADATMMEGTVERDEALTSESGGALVYMDYATNNWGALTSMEGYRIHENDTLKSNMTKLAAAKFFQICPIWSGEECEGIIASRIGGNYPRSSASSRHLYRTPKDCGTITLGTVSTQTLISCPKAYLGYTSYRRDEYRLRINLDLLFDVRYNPFEDASGDNEGGNYDSLKNWCNYGYVPIKLYIEDANGVVLYHYENYRILDSNDCKHSGNLEGWKAGAADWGKAYLCYYDPDDLKSSCGFAGWKTNKPIIGYYRGDLPGAWSIMGDGEFITLPPCGGYLRLEIGEGVHQFDYDREVKNIYKYVRYVAYKSPSITLCRKNYKEVEMDDIEDSAWINAAAKESLEIDTILGTMTQRHGVPNAKGQLFDNNFNIIYEFTRAGVTERLERLLIGTVYSQYGSRHAVFAGTAEILPTFGVLGDAASEGKFILLEEVQDCIEDESEIKMSEFEEDNYTGIEYE